MVDEGGEERERFLLQPRYPAARLWFQRVTSSVACCYPTTTTGGVVSSHLSTVFEKDAAFKEHLVKTLLGEGNVPKINIQVQITYNPDRGFSVDTGMRCEVRTGTGMVDI